MRQSPANLVLAPQEGARLFTNGLYGYVALAGNGRRVAYLQHAYYGDVCERAVTIKPARIGNRVKSQGVIVANAFEPLAPIKASASHIPYDKLSTYDDLEPIVKDVVRACGSADAVTIVPYYEGSQSNGYARSLAIDVPPNRPGILVVEGRVLQKPGA